MIAATLFGVIGVAPGTAAAVLGGYAAVLLAAAVPSVLRCDIA